MAIRNRKNFFFLLFSLDDLHLIIIQKVREKREKNGQYVDHTIVCFFLFVFVMTAFADHYYYYYYDYFSSNFFFRSHKAHNSFGFFLWIYSSLKIQQVCEQRAGNCFVSFVVRSIRRRRRPLKKNCHFGQAISLFYYI